VASSFEADLLDGHPSHGGRTPGRWTTAIRGGWPAHAHLVSLLDAGEHRIAELADLSVLAAHRSPSP